MRKEIEKVIKVDIVVCDRCGKECENYYQINVSEGELNEITDALIEKAEFHLCKDCYIEFIALVMPFMSTLDIKELYTPSLVNGIIKLHNALKEGDRETVARILSNYFEVDIDEL